MIVLFACKKEKVKPGTSSPEPPPVISLKDVVLPHLPSPYYHFEYDSSGKVPFVSFDSDFNRYHVIYDGGRIIEMRNDIL